DIPLAPREVVEHQVLEQVCRCGRVHVGAFPGAVTETVQYGPNEPLAKLAERMKIAWQRKRKGGSGRPFLA
ncbi:hypothetical protein, partial [Massilia genomosp. 1]|uniref:hypothetical protein n=1 Tax=Massilia genomosp. 1 TaxID=2609280 RepID=UPI001C9E9B1C